MTTHTTPEQDDAAKSEENSLQQLETMLPVDDFEEDVSEGGKKVRRKGVYLLPNLFTTGALFSGFYAIVSGMHGHFEAAALAIIVAMFFDILDGRVARLTNAQSAFGAEYDSLSDMVSFGVAPALVAFSWALSPLGKVGWAAAFIYLASAAVRLARFNALKESDDDAYFTGLASPAGAVTIACIVWMCADLGLYGEDLPLYLSIIVAIVIVLIGLLMVSNFKYRSFKDVNLRGRVPLVVLVLGIVVFALIAIDPPTVLLAMLIIYILSGPVLGLKKPE